MKNFILEIFKVKGKLCTSWSIFCLIILSSSQLMYGQSVPLESSLHVNFGVDADIYSGLFSFSPDDGLGTDDWLEGASGLGVIDVTDAASIAELATGANVSKEFRMSVPIYTPVNGDTWIDAVYLRDQNTKGGNQDMTVFGGGADKNFDDPTTWTVKNGDVPQKNDIIDIYAHLRRDSDAPPPFNYLFAFTAASTRSENGTSYLDFEYFRVPVTFDAVNEQLVTTGPDCGHTSYDFDTGNGSVISNGNGDIIVSTNYTNGGSAADVRLYAWIDSDQLKGLDGDATSFSDADFAAYNLLPLRPFNFGDDVGDFEFYNCNNDTNIPYGYARFSLRNDLGGDPLFAQVNITANATAPPWGTISSSGDFTPEYIAPTLAEYGINASILGLDTSGQQGQCQAPLGSVIVKTRSSDSFTAELKDLAGPFNLGDTPEYTVTVGKDGDLSCAVEQVTLTASPNPPGTYTYVWYKDGIEIPGQTASTLVVSEPGIYKVFATVDLGGTPGCTAESDPLEVLQNIIQPEVIVVGGVLICDVEEVQLSGTISSTNPDADLSFSWSGPDGYSSDLLNPIVAVAGTYTLSVIDNNNGCDISADAEVTGDPDVTPPEISCPATLEVQCSSDVPAADIGLVTATDNSGAAPTVIHVGDVSDGQTCPETITRTYRATDACGNSADCIQLIIINDTIAPQLESAPADASYQCAEDVPAAGILNWTDNCDGAGEVQGSDSSDGQTCPETITRTWSYTDACGNTASVSQTITVNDTIAPELTAPSDASYQCADDVPAAGMLGWTDNCDGAGEVQGSDSSDGQTCPETITRTWSYTDACGNTASVSQTITINDTIAPEFDTPPADASYQCAEDVPDGQKLVWTDNCDGTGDVDAVDSSDGLTCPETITRTWSYTDACGNTASVSQTITVNDTIAPELTAPSDASYQCADDVPAAGMLGWTDNCDGAGEVQGSDSSDGQTCPETITRTWSYTDACGNTTSVSQTITVNDTIAPEFDTPPADASYQCAEDVPDGQKLVWTDNCDGTGDVDAVDSSDGLTCPETITRTWSYTDACGNTASVSQTITVNDTIAPELTAPSDASYQCADDVPAAGMLGWTDNCDGAGEVQGSDSSDGQTCPETITRTWSYTDACGNTTSVSQTITVNDTIAPEFDTPPADASYQCAEDVPDGQKLVWTDNCDGTGDVDAVDSSDGQTCPETITRTWSYTDACGNTASVSQTITVNDTIAPELTAPADASYQCADDVPAAGMLGWTDNCDGAGEVQGSDSSDGQTCPETITRTWSYTDACGNTTSVSQTITVNDTIAPEFDTPPADASYQCAEDVPDGQKLVWTDNCDGTGDVDAVDSSDGLTCPETITRTWSYTDACGNTASVSQTITVNDTIAPELTAPSDASYQCADDVPAAGMLGWTDNCDGAGEVQGSDSSDGQTCPETITRTWSYTDACGNTTSVSQTITVNDTIAPEFDTPPADASYQCAEDVPDGQKLVWTDNCDGTGDVDAVDSSDGLTCPETITRTWSYTDACGNTASVSQTITVNDTIAPELTAPADASYQCADDVPAAGMLGWTDNCDGAGEVQGSDSSDGQTCPETITRTWSYTDACGNTTSVSQTITVNDTIAPEFDTPPADASYQCAEDVPAAGMLGWTDNCDGAGEVQGSDSSDGQTCPETITRTWSYTDACGNTASVSQTITVNDTIAPELTAPSDASYQCADDVPAAGMLGWTDNCDGAGEVQGSDSSDGQSCPETITRTWSYTDACGNTTSVSQTITVNDTIAPEFETPPADASYQCAEDVPDGQKLVWTDNCDGTGDVDAVDSSDGQTCPETITRTWSYTDACGNTASVSQTITVNDTIAPELTAPSDASYQCADDVPAAGMLGWTDNCDGAGEVQGSDSSDGQTCPETITRTWSYTDACGNTTSVSQTITVNDTIAPEFETPPADTSYQCAEDVINGQKLVWTDNCDGTGVVDAVDSSDGLTCPETITRTWTYTDACGNTTTVSQTIIVIDTIAPELTAPSDASYQCADDVPAAGMLDWTDNCGDGSGQVQGSDSSDGQTCPETITRTWSYTDACDNTTSVSQTITVHDTIAPELYAPKPATYQCADDVPAAGMLGWTDNCDGAGEVQGSDSSDGQTCPETITRTWSYTDACGNTTSVSQTITVNDTIAPIFETPPADASYQCADDVPAAGVLGWTDNCDYKGEVQGSDSSDGLTCPETITRTWTYTDACGNTASVSQTITINDTIAPELTAPADASYQCADDVPAAGMLGWTDNCDGAGEVQGSDSSDGQTCPETITRTWSYTDACGNTASVSQTITVNDTIAPELTAPSDASYQCADDVPAAGMLGWTDNCDGAGEVQGSDSSDGQTCPETITRTWSYTDACGNTTSVSQTITVNDTIAPEFDTPPADASYQCAEDVPDGQKLVWTDNCDGTGDVDAVDSSDGLTCPETITRTWSYTDACGNTASVSQTITVNDTIAPELTAPADASYQCADDVPAAGMLGWTDNCDGAGEVQGSDSSDGQTCPETITRTWSYTDACGNTTSVSQTITVNDTIAPEFDTPPADASYQCAEDVPAAGMLGWTDNCDGAGEVQGSDSSDGQTCPETITRTWSYTDACGNTASVSQTITVNDTIAPELTAPSDASYQCADDVPAAGMLGWTDNCDGAGEVQGSDSSDGQTCPETITRTWSYTDACGNTTSVSQTITVNDTIAPEFETPPADASYQCAEDVPDGQKLVWTDNCDGTGDVDAVDSSDGQTCPETITRTWSYTDACGNTASVSQTITVNDTIAPELTAPSDASYQCADDVPAAGMLGWTDNCDGAGEVQGSDSSDGQTCPETITRTWSYTDACGNTTSVSQTITVNDTIAPEFDTPPADASYQCAEDVPDGQNLVWTDNCDGTGDVDAVDSSDGQTCPETITRTWSYTDACGNTASVSQTITVNDTIAPELTAPSDASYQCADDVPAAGMLGWTDNCDGAGEVQGSDSSDGQTCPETITRTWSYTDACGNTTSVSQTITVNDTIAPEFDTPPADASYQCAEDVPDGQKLVWTDNCDGTGDVDAVDSSDGLTCPETITRTWSYTDACGNTASVSQTITVNDTIAPELTAPSDASYQCADDVPAAGMLGWTDNCDGAGEVQGSDSSDGQTCPETITRTWSYTDACGNTTSVSQTITVNDTIAPELTAPSDASYQCADDVPAAGMLGWTDNCDGAGEVQGSDSSDGQTCPETITRTWSYTDACGNTASVSQTITVNDTIAPELTAPADASYQCADDVPAAGMLGWTDNCDGAGEVQGSDSSDGQTCPETITRTWSYTDACGNTTSVSQTITVNDTIAPEFDTPPADASYQCAEDVPDGQKLVWTDNCDGTGDVDAVDSSDGQTCPETITRTWSYTDACGNTASVSQTITVDDTIAPVIELPVIELDCDEEFPAVIKAYWTDNCSGEGVITAVPSNFSSDPDGCTEYVDYVFTIEDDCGNLATETLKVQREIELQEECETAFGRLDDGGECFQPDFSRWGWSNEIIEEGSYQLNLYAGAAHCNIDNGAFVGTVDVDYIDGMVTVTYNIADGYTMNEAHLYIGCDQYPIGSSGDETVAPGQYNFNPGSIDDLSTLTIGPIEVDGPFWLIAHAVTCEVLCSCTEPQSGEYVPEDYEPIECGELLQSQKPLNEVGFKAYPVPFKDVINISYEFDFETDVTVEIVDMQGLIIKKITNSTYTRKSEGITQFDLSQYRDQMLFIKVSTSQGSVVKQIISTNNKR